MSSPSFDYLRSTTQSLTWFNATYRAGQLELAPPFQRKPVWTHPQKSLLIDTILMGYPIPEVYMQHSVKPDGEERHIVVDGQQRLRSCLEFLTGDFEIQTNGNSSWEGASFDDLADPEKTRVLSYQFVVRVLPDVPDPIIRAVFKRLNQNTVALNRQELRHATYWGRFLVTATEIAELEYWSEFGLFTPNAIRRMLDTEYVSELIILALHGVQNKKTTLDKWYRIYEQQGFEAESEVRRTFDVVLRTIENLLPDIRKTRWKKRSDFYSLFGALCRIEDDLPLSKRDIRTFGKDLVAFAESVDLNLGVISRLQADVKSSAFNKIDVIKYSRAVERAASDLANRRIRENVILELLDYDPL